MQLLSEGLTKNTTETITRCDGRCRQSTAWRQAKLG
jgi:hypothetical protein